MEESSHHGRVIREYRDKVGITQDELARRVGRSRRTIVDLEKSARVGDAKLRRTLAWALQIPPAMLGLLENTLPAMAVLTPLDTLSEERSFEEKSLGRVVFETFSDNLRMRLDLYYIGSSLAADKGLNEHIGRLERQLDKVGSKSRKQLFILLSHNYQLKGMIARDQLDYAVAEKCFQQSSLLAQEADCVELNALSMARQAVVYVWQWRFNETTRQYRGRLNEADQLYSVAREISKHSAPSVRAFLATAHAEVQGLLKDRACLSSLTDARHLLRRVDPDDDYLLLAHATRCSEGSVNDGWSQCHSLLGMPNMAIESYDKIEDTLDLSMTRMRGRLYIQYAEALSIAKDLGCCFYATEGLRLARAVGSQYNIQRVKELSSKLKKQFPGDARVKELLQAVQS
jgi:DNA-binding XRE family transcriptional regulator